MGRATLGQWIWERRDILLLGLGIGHRLKEKGGEQGFNRSVMIEK